MSGKRICIGIAGIFLALVPVSIRAQDLAAQYGTKSPEAARLLSAAIELIEGSKIQDALQQINTALSVDPSFQMAMYWKGIAYQELGDFDKAMESYHMLYRSTAPGKTLMPVEGCFNAGIFAGKSGKHNQSALWFSRGIVLDPGNEYGKSAKFYRNLAITLAQKGDHSSATLCAVLGHQLDPKAVEEEMIKSFSRNAKQEVATVLHLPTKHVEIPYRDSVKYGEPQVVDGVDGNVACLVDLVEQRSLLILPMDQKFVQLLDYAKPFKVRRIETQGRPRAASYVGGKLFLSLTSPDRIAVMDTKTGKEESSWRLNQPAPSSIAVAPEKRVAMFANSGKIRILDLDDGSIEISPFEATSLASDPMQQHLYALRTPDLQLSTETGHFLVNGRPVFFQIDNDQSGDLQSTLFRFNICEKTLVLAQTRICAASNGRRVCVSPGGEVVAVVGGGGWRPLDRSAGHGYGVAVFATNDFSRVIRFIETDAYPLAAAINPVSHLIAARGGKFVLSHLVNDDELEIKLENGSEGLNSDNTFIQFSGDGKWLFANNKSQLYAIPTELQGKEDAKKWYRQLLKPPAIVDN